MNFHIFQKNPRAHKNKIGTPPPPQNPKYPPPPKRGILWTQVFLQKERIFPGVHKIGAAISGPRIADTNFTDTRIFLIFIPRMTPNVCELAPARASGKAKDFLSIMCKWRRGRSGGQTAGGHPKPLLAAQAAPLQAVCQL